MAKKGGKNKRKMGQRKKRKSAFVKSDNWEIKTTNYRKYPRKSRITKPRR